MKESLDRPSGFASAWPAWAFGIFAIAATVFTLVYVRPNVEMRGQVARLAVRLPLVGPQTARGDEADPTPRRRAILAYAAKDYATAERLLVAEVKERSADAEALILLGSTLLLTDRPTEAREPLQAAARLAQTPRLREEALWQTAQATLLLGRKVEATVVLQEIIDTGSTRSAEARAVLDQLSSLH